MIRVLITGSNELFRVGIGSILSTQMKELLDVKEVDSDQALKECLSFKPQIILIDIDSGGGSGLQLTTQLVSGKGLPRVIIFTDQTEPSILDHQFRTGATGFLTKSVSVNECLAAVSAAIRNQGFVSHQYSQLVTLGKIDGFGNRRLKSLSRRELDVTKMLAEGKSHHEISALLSISPKTVSTYKHRIHQKLKTQNTADITRFAIKSGVLTHL